LLAYSLRYFKQTVYTHFTQNAERDRQRDKENKKARKKWERAIRVSKTRMQPQTQAQT
jgi:hypothetical protein